MSAALVVCRAVLAVVFGVAGSSKLADRAGTRAAIIDFGLPTRWARPAAVALPIAELSVVVLVAFSSTGWWGALLAALLLVAFVVAIARLLRRGEAPECHCFGQLRATRIGRATLVRNAVLLVPAGVVLAHGPSDAGPGLAAAFSRDRPGELVLGALVVVMVVVVAWMANVITDLRRQQAELRTSVELVERLFDERAQRRPDAQVAAAGTPRPGLPVGVNAPIATSIGRDGRDGLVAPPDGPLTLLVFATATCGPCRELLLQLDDRERSGVAITVVLPGDHDDNRRLIRDFPSLHLVFAGDQPVAAAFRVNVTPGALLVAGGRIRSRPAYGVAAILELLDHAELAGSAPPSPGSRVGAVPPPHAELDARDGRPVALLYWRDTCPHCAGMVTDLAAWAAADGDPNRPRLVMVTAAEAPLSDDFGAAQIVDASGEMASQLGLPGTPAAVLIGADGTIASDPCIGADDVRLLLGVGRTPRPTPIDLSPKPADAVAEPAS